LISINLRGPFMRIAPLLAASVVVRGSSKAQTRQYFHSVGKIRAFEFG
jgi:hypothetical protein